MARIAVALPGVRAAALGFMRGSASVVFPWSGASADLDFIRRQYRWNGASRLESDFTTFVLGGSTFGPAGLDVSTGATLDITISLATLSITMPPCCFGFAGYFPSAPAATKAILQIDDGTNNDRFALNTLTNPSVNIQVIDNNVVQSGQNFAAIVPNPGVRFGVALSADLNDVKAASNGAASVADTVATMPTVTTLRIGKNVAGSSNSPAILSRLVIFTAVKTQAEINQLSIDMRDAV